MSLTVGQVCSLIGVKSLAVFMEILDLVAQSSVYCSIIRLVCSQNCETGIDGYHFAHVKSLIF